MRRLRIGVAFVVLFGLAEGSAQVRQAPPVFTVNPATATCSPSDTPCRDWLRFRRLPAGPYQSLAIASHGERATVILSEPPAPRAEFRALVEATFGADLIALSYRRWATGLDAWLEDLVLDVRVPNATVSPALSGHDLRRWNAPAGLVDRLRFLHVALYGTTDGFWIDNVNAFPERPSTPPIQEPALAPADLLDWLTDAKRTWQDVNDPARTLSFASAGSAKSPSVLVGSDKTLVLMVVPGHSQLASLAEPFRRFSVASDLLLGAYRTNTGTTFVAGRARQLSFTVLPPLRFETLASFIEHRTAELFQSYERQRIFAGRVTSGPFEGWDWAPIMLSNQLDDSEFGTLLNQADQILKSWSQAGAVDYYAFAHPKPPVFPFGRESASDYFARQLGTTSLVFNWNTQAFSTIHELQQGELITIDRYGALPILYMPSGSILEELSGGSADVLRQLLGDTDSKADTLPREAAAGARRYFAERGDPILVRVSQNVPAVPGGPSVSRDRRDHHADRARGPVGGGLEDSAR